MSRDRRAMSGRSRLFSVVAVCAACVMAAACGEPAPDAPAHDDLRGYTVPARTPDATYTVRGRVRTVPVAGNPLTQLAIEHEAIPRFTNKDGRAVGMGHMTMHFPPARGVDVSGLRAGEPVEVTFSVWWGEAPSYLLMSFTRLPADVRLAFDEPAR